MSEKEVALEVPSESDVEQAEFAKVVEDLKAADPDAEVYAVPYVGVSVVFQPMDRKTYEVFQNRIREESVGSTEGMTDEAVNLLILEYTVRYPALPELQKHIDRRAGLLDSLANDIQVVSGFQPIQPPVQL